MNNDSEVAPTDNTWNDLMARPCEHMTNFVHAHIDKQLRGPALWYTRFHVWHCPKCKCAASVLQRLQDSFRRTAWVTQPSVANCLSVERIDALNRAVNELEITQ